jgi:hypothetical protein
MTGIIVAIILLVCLFLLWIKYLAYCRNWEKFSSKELPGD